MTSFLLSVLCLFVMAALGWLGWRLHSLSRLKPKMMSVEHELARQTEHGNALGVVVKRHIQQSLASRQQVRHVQRQLDALRSQLLQGKACDSAIALVRKGKDIKPLVSRGELNSAEAHLIRLVHSDTPRSARRAPKH